MSAEIVVLLCAVGYLLIGVTTAAIITASWNDEIFEFASVVALLWGPLLAIAIASAPFLAVGYGVRSLTKRLLRW